MRVLFRVCLTLTAFGMLWPIVTFQASGQTRLTDVSDHCGIDFVHTDGSSGKHYIVESVVCGLALLDFDNDGWIDIYFLNGAPLPGTNVSTSPTNVLYRNNGDFTFTDVTDAAGVGDLGYGLGVVAGDYDQDGDWDLYISNFGQNVFYVNNGDGDGDSDIVVANDQFPNSLLINDGQGLFSDEGIPSGIAFDRTGKANGNMGIDCADLDGDGLVDLFTTTYQDEMPVLYKNLGNGLFLDITNVARIDNSLFPHVNWGCGLVDFDNDADKDIFIACGHFMDNIQYIDDRTSVKVRNYLLQNDGKGRFTNITKDAGTGLEIIESSRGAAFDDLDNDGDIDVVVVNANGRPSILRNDSTPKYNWVAVQLIGTASNRMGIGAKVSVVSEDRTQVAYVIAGRGYQSHYGTKLHFGLGRTGLNKIQVRWNSGKTEEFEGRAFKSSLTLIERQLK